MFGGLDIYYYICNHNTRDTMRTGRPVNPGTIYRVGIHRNGGHVYATTQPFTIGADGRKHYRHRHWGTVDESAGMKFFPGTEYLLASPEERSKLIFPQDWDLSELKKLPGERERGAVVYDGEDLDRQWGCSWLLGQVADRIGLRSDLDKVFDGNKEMTNQVLSLAAYPFLGTMSYNRMARWQREVKTFTETDLTRKKITLLTQKITEQNRMDLFRLRAKRLGKGELGAVDSTSISTYGRHLVDIRWGHNKEGLPLQQTLEVVVYSLTSHMPVFYMELPGNEPDSRTIDTILMELEHAGFKDLVLITDRGYESMKNLEGYILKGQPMIMCVSVHHKDVLDRIRALEWSGAKPVGMTAARDEAIYYRQYNLSLRVRGNGSAAKAAKHYKLNLYYDPALRASGEHELDVAIDIQKDTVTKLIETKTKFTEDGRKAVETENGYLIIEWNKRGTIKSFTENEDKITHKRLTMGFHAIKTVFQKDLAPLEARRRYGLRDEQEKCFELQKGPMFADRMRAWSEGGKKGLMFIWFVGLTMASYVRSVWLGSKPLRDKFDSTEAILDEMRSIRCIEHKGHRKFITPFVGDQMVICNAFGFEPPAGCGTEYVSRAIPDKKRGRPAKPKVEQQTS